MGSPTVQSAAQDSGGTRSRGNQSRTGILSAAARLFRQQGYAAVSLRNIAEEAGLKAGSLYHHFESKERIIEEIINTGVQNVFDNVRQAVEALPEETDHLTRFRTAITAHLEALHAHSDYTSASVRIFWQLPDKVRQTNIEVRLAYESYWQSLLTAAREDGCIHSSKNLTIFLLFLLGALNASLEWFNPELGGVDSVAKDYADVLLKGLMSGPGGDQ